MSTHSGQCQSLADQLAQALTSLGCLLDLHGPGCVCCHCTTLHRAHAALDALNLLCTIVDAQTRYEWDTQTAGPFTEIANALVSD